MSIKSRVSEAGRSMIEMLGVLAIVGVLTLGAISGYQRAMTKHRINKVVQELGTTISNILLYQNDFIKLNSGKAITSAETLKQLMILAQQLELVPNTWYLKEGASCFKDSYGGDFFFGTRGIGTRMYFTYRLKRSKKSLNSGSIRICQEIWTQIFKPLSGIIRNVHMQMDGSSQGNWVGSEYCGTETAKCLDDITPELIYNECARCLNTEGACQATMDVK